MKNSRRSSIPIRSLVGFALVAAVLAALPVTTYAHQVPLPGASITKWVDPLPQFPARVDGTKPLRVTATEIQQKVLPANLYPAPYATGTYVWAYGGLRRGGSGTGGGGTGSGGGSPSGNGGGGTGPVSLARAGMGLPGTSLQQLATVSAPKFESERSRPQDVDRAKVRQLAGASLLGPTADQNVLAHQTPSYPDWAEVQGVEATVSLYFVVRPDGRIKENILVEKTSGFEDFDANAVTALRGWRFEALGPGSTGEQWGRNTFHFRLASG